MRRSHYGAVLLALATFARPAGGALAGPADGPGCLGIQLTDCLGWLRATMVVSESFLGDALARRHPTDVNGRPMGGGLVPVYARLPSRMDQFVILLHLRPDDTVQRVESNLLSNLMTARTEAVYDTSQFYEIAWRLIGRRCPGMTKIELYRFFENSVKPRINQKRRDFSSGINGLHQIVSHADAAPYCGGVSLAYTSLLQWRASSDPQAAAKPTEFSSIELR